MYLFTNGHHQMGIYGAPVLNPLLYALGISRDFLALLALEVESL
jgi:hypothetical protein